MQERILTAEQVAKILQVHIHTVLKYIKEGKLKGMKLGRVYRIKESDVGKFLEEQAEKAHKPKDKETLEKAGINPNETKEEPKKEKEEDHYIIE